MKQHIKTIKCGARSCRFEVFEDGSKLFISYNTPVGFVDATGQGFITEEKYSRTTSRQITQDFKKSCGYNVKTKPQSFLNEIARENGFSIGRGVSE
jgi:hypothetical protein